MNEAVAAQKKGSPLTLIMMIVVFAAPVVGAWFLYLNPQFLPSSQSNRGELIQPMVPVNAELGLLDEQGKPLDLKVFDGMWTLVVLTAGDCSQECRDQLISVRQIRLALGETSKHVERLWVQVDRSTASSVDKEFDGMYSALADQRLLKALGEGEQALNRIYILDPMGNLMMRYAPDASPKDPLKDMERLLKASKNWLKGASYGHR